MFIHLKSYNLFYFYFVYKIAASRNVSKNIAKRRTASAFQVMMHRFRYLIGDKGIRNTLLSLSTSRTVAFAF